MPNTKLDAIINLGFWMIYHVVSSGYSMCILLWYLMVQVVQGNPVLSIKIFSESKTPVRNKMYLGKNNISNQTLLNGKNHATEMFPWK